MGYSLSQDESIIARRNRLLQPRLFPRRRRIIIIEAAVA